MKNLLAVGVLYSLMVCCLFGAESTDARLDRLFTRYMAPCCWRQTLREHTSPESTRLQLQIRSMVSRGSSDHAIERELVREFGIRILAVPEGTPAFWLWAAPLLVLAGGTVLVTASLARMKKTHQPALPGEFTDLPGLYDWQEWPDEELNTKENSRKTI